MVVFVVKLQMCEEKVQPTWDGCSNITDVWGKVEPTLDGVSNITDVWGKVEPTWDGSSNISDVYGESSAYLRW